MQTKMNGKQKKGHGGTKKEVESHYRKFLVTTDLKADHKQSKCNPIVNHEPDHRFLEATGSRKGGKAFGEGGCSQRGVDWDLATAGNP